MKNIEMLGYITATAVRQVRQAEVKIHELIRGQTEPVSDVDFWNIVNAMRLEIEKFQAYGRGTLAFEQGIEEPIRAAMYDSKATARGYGFAESLADLTQEIEAEMGVWLTYARFARQYERLVGKLDRKIAPWFDYHGDGFGDLVDSLPLAGYAVIEAIFDGRIATEQQLRTALAVDEWSKKYVGGENYIQSTMVKVLTSKFESSWACHAEGVDNLNSRNG